MSSVRFSIEYCTAENQRRRVVYYADMDGLRWFRRVDHYEDGQWRHGSNEQIAAPRLKIKPVDGGLFTGP